MRIQNETESDAKTREENAYNELLSHSAELKYIYSVASPELKEFLQWMIDVYAADQCGRFRGELPYLVRGE